ncbi:MAG: amidohydrolase family protein [Planctomycetota bacterium]|nr:amidohydrolase family protein [Planctomycetota bacterium]
MTQVPTDSELRLLQAGAVIDAAGVEAQPGVLLVRGNEVIAAGTPPEVGDVSEATVEDCQGDVLLPALVNAHAHLDLSGIGPRPFDGHFDTWLAAIRAHRMEQDAPALEADFAHGISLSFAGGVAFIGDILGRGSDVGVGLLQASSLEGTCFLECMGLGLAQEQSIETIQERVAGMQPGEHGIRIGVSPHAPYSCGPALYEACAALGIPLATHLAESLEEEQVLSDASGPFRELAEHLGAWNDATTMPGCHPVEALRGIIQERPVLAVHLNYIEEAHLTLLADAGTRVVYCPRASDYFGHPHAGRPDHRYMDMLNAGMCVALGTDSLQCLDTPERISTLDEMRHLHVRDGADPMALLSMATVQGARALELDPSLVSFSPGPVAGVIAVDVSGGRSGGLAGVLSTRGAPRWVVDPGQ